MAGLESYLGSLSLDDDDVKGAVLVQHLPSNSWFEGFAPRPNGGGLASRLDAPELYLFHGSNSKAELELVYTFPSEEATGVVNLCPLLGRPDEFAVITGLVDMATVSFQNFIFWRVKLDSANVEPPVVTRLATLPEAGFCIGLVAATERTLLVADSAKHCIWQMDIESGKSSLLLEDSLMEAASEEDFFGLNRIRVGGGYVWFTNSSAGLLGRFAVDIKEGEATEITASGPIEILAADIQHCDGLALSKDFTAAFAVSYLGGFMWKVSLDKDGGLGSTRVVMQHLVSPTHVEIAYLDGEPKIYVVCCGQIEHGWVNDHDRASWSDLANINAAVSVTVTISEEVETA